MNYGKFFRLNRSLSKIEEGIAIYDYVDLPAYFTPSVENHLSPKYPISVNISQSSVSFRLHYCAFKIEGQKDNLENYTYYTYDSDDLKIKSDDKNKSGDDIKLAHMEEVILELPFIENTTSILSDIIKDIYITNFPQMIGGSTSTGGRFLEQLIHKRYPKSSEWRSIEELKKEGDTEALLYGTLREASDDSPSYSTLWLMDLIKDVEGEKDKKRIDLYNKKDGSVVAFLRKLLLDFMFDLKHSDVFQNSSCYQKMYSGLMSDFFFSALMHKCEYYYYRELTRLAIDDNEKVDKTIPKEENDKRKKLGKKSITALYANELVKAEDLWIKDIMNPLAEKEFEHRYPGEHKVLREFFEFYFFEKWPSWFAEPEEEMRRVCFTMKDNTGERHICNADTLVENLGLEKQNDIISRRMVNLRDNNREVVSRWFLKRYDFNDVVHLHFFKWFNLAVMATTISFLFIFFGWNEWIDRILYFVRSCKKTLILPVFFCLVLILINNLILSEKDFSIIVNKWIKKIGGRGEITHKLLSLKSVFCGRLSKARFVLTLKRLSVNAFMVSVLVSLFYMIFESDEKVVAGMLSIIIAILCLLFVINKRLRFWPSIHVIRNLHLLFPRLVAAITAAWFAMSMGFDIYVSFFDALPAWYTALAISVIVFGFIMYEINQIMPSCSSARKFFRSFEFLLISYCISLLVGLVVINFVGEKYLERGGYVEDYYKEYVNGDTAQLWNHLDYTRLEKEKIDTSSIHGKVDALQKIGHKGINDSLIAKPIIFQSKHVLFIMPDFLIMFSFIAMFWGIFIQMIFTGEKQMTEL